MNDNFSSNEFDKFKNKFRSMFGDNNSKNCTENEDTRYNIPGDKKSS